MSLLLGLLPDLLTWAPHILGGATALGGLAGLFPNLRSYALIGLAIVAAGGIGWGLLERGNYQAEKAGRIADGAAALAKAKEAEAAAKKDADRREAAVAAELSIHRGISADYREMIAHEPPSTCAPSAAARTTSRGVGLLLAEPRPARASAAQ